MVQKGKERKKKGQKTQPKDRIGAFGTVFFSWDFPEFGTAWKSKTWYKLAILIAVILLVYTFFTSNYLFSVIIILTSIIYFFQSFDSPLTINCQITEDGVAVGNKFYDYRDLSKFWIIYEPPEVKNLYLEFTNPFKPRLGIPLFDQNPLAIRQVLEQYVDEDVERENEPISDGLARMFKMHH